MTQSTPISARNRKELSLHVKKAAEFKVYCRDHLADSTIFLGKIPDRRRKEGNIMSKTYQVGRMQFSDVEDSSILLLDQ
jgi:hypothetical protein